MALRQHFVCGGEYMKYGHLERINVTLRALGPVFIGSGESFNKKEYIFNSSQGLIHFLHLPRFVSFLKSRNLLNSYEKFLIDPRSKDLHKFLLDHNVQEDDYSAFVIYSIEAGEAAQAPNFREVLPFLKDPSGHPYIPGSSLKGALRTALGAYLLKRDNWDRLRQDIERADTNINARRYLKREKDVLERQLYYRLQIRNPRDNRPVSGAINDFMQGIRISDSAPLDFSSLTLAGKYDRKPDGTVSPLPIFRECLKPDSEASLVITLDLPVLAKVGLTLGDIEKSLHSFADEYYANFEQHFAELSDDAPLAAQQGVDIILGGGAGYVSKTLTYNLFPQTDKALALVAKIMSKQFPARHGHTRDVNVHSISPHMLKTARYAGQYYQMGRCELIFN